MFINTIYIQITIQAASADVSRLTVTSHLAVTNHLREVVWSKPTITCTVIVIEHYIRRQLRIHKHYIIVIIIYCNQSTLSVPDLLESNYSNTHRRHLHQHQLTRRSPLAARHSLDPE